MICVANVGRIDRQAVEELEKYVKAGGGVLFVTGPLTRGVEVTQDLYRKGEGLFPVPLAEPEQLAVDPLDNTPDVQSEDHYVFHNIEHRVENISKIFVQQYFAAPAGWSAKSDPALRVIMRLRNGATAAAVGGEELPGRGRVVALLSTTAGDWNNWYTSKETGFSFGTFFLDLVPYLSHSFGAGDTLLVGEPKTMTFGSPAVRADGPLFRSRWRLGLGHDQSGRTDARHDHPERRTVTYLKTERAGFYQALLTQSSHKTDARHFAVNVDAGEGDLHALSGSDLAYRLAPLKYEFEYAAKYDLKLDETQGRNLGDLFLLILLLVLMVEQWFAWSCSYHVSSRPSAWGSASGERERRPIMIPPQTGCWRLPRRRNDSNLAASKPITIG